MTTFEVLDARDAPGHEYGWFMADSDRAAAADLRTWVSVDLVAITDDPDDPALVLYRRERDPHAGQLSLPGAVLDPAKGQTVAQTATWIAQERAHASVVEGTVAHPITVVSDADRDERGHTVSLVCLTRVHRPANDAVLVHTGDAVPDAMPFGHGDMLAHAARRAFDSLLHDPAVARALVSESVAFGTTGAGLWSTLRLLHHLAGGDPEQAPSAEAVRRRRSRSDVIVAGGTIPATTRPETVYVSAPLR